jgi:hypothetical protein
MNTNSSPKNQEQLFTKESSTTGTGQIGGA